ncbi:MAG: glycine--tRNA ligase subunit beta, partial [Deltaproteobacteria bacterium]|nr:glycine--tRNA ligase subunit beta [Deltaproteobacteria bacterium]
MAKELLLEIGTEEIPAAFLPKALKDMERIITGELSENRIGHGRLRTMGTPRRLLLSIEDVEERQEDQVLEKMGPSTAVAFDEGGSPTKAAIGFARGQGVEVSELEIVETPKGKQICARKKIIGEDTLDILKDLLPRFILSIPFRKSMRWMDLGLRFARPIHWILAIFGGEVIPFSIENITSSDTSRGHRFMAPEPFKVEGFEDYLKKTEERFVIVDPDRRKKIIQDEAKA